MKRSFRMQNKKIFQWDAYCTLANHTCFGHQMSVLVGGPQVNKFEQVSSDCHQMSLVGGTSWIGMGLEILRS